MSDVTNPAALLAVGSVIATTILIGVKGRRFGRTTSDLLVASRSVHPLLNALAICGEYLSAGTFLGLAGLVLVFGVDMLWYPVGFTMGYVVLLLFVAAPLRRFGAYTIADFAAGRLEAPRLRKLSAGFVLVVCWLYLLPQMKGAGVVLGEIAGTPYWVGVVLVGLVVTANVSIGGMRSITYVQAFHYLVKVVTISIPAVVMLVAWQGDDRQRITTDSVPRFEEVVSVTIPAPVTVRVSEPTAVVANGAVDERSIDGEVVLSIGEHALGAGTMLTFDAGDAVPHRSDLPTLTGEQWFRPLRDGSSADEHPTYFVYSLIFATFLGTMGLPHIVIRFYTNRDGGAARRTTLTVVALLGLFYIFPPLYGVLGRSYTPDLLVTGQSDNVLLQLPGRVIGGAGATALVAVLSAGAFAAFLSTASGLLVSIAGSVSHDLVGGRVRAFRIAAIGGGTVAVALGLAAESFAINVLVGWAFAVAASAFCPVILLGVWWRRLTSWGAIVGMVVGGGLATAAIVTTMVAPELSGWPGALLAQPAAWSVPTAFAATVVVSLRTPHLVPKSTMSMFISMHIPESLGVGRPLRP